MNKYILATFIILLAVQGLDAQFISGVISLFTSVSGFIFNAVLSVPSIIFNYAATFTVIVSNVTLAALSAVNAGAYNALLRINNFTSNVDNITNQYYSILQNRTSTGTFLGRTVIGNLYDAINEIGYTTNSLASIVLGCRPSQPPPISFLNVYYPLPDSCLSTTNCTSATVACVAGNFRNLAEYQINNINATALFIQRLAEDFGSSVAENATAVAEIIIAEWTSLREKASQYLTVNSLGSLLTYASDSFNENFTEVMNQMTIFMNSINEATNELLNSTNILNFQIIDFERLQRFEIWNEIFERRSRRWAFISSLIGYNTFRANVESALTAINNTAYEFAQSIDEINPEGFVYETAQAHSSAFQNLVNQVNSSLLTFLINFNTTVNAVEQSVSDIVLNATESLNGTFNELIATILNENITDCLNFTASAAEALAEFSLGIQTCGQNADKDIETINANATSIFIELMSNVSTFMNTSNSCFSDACEGNSGYSFFVYGVRCANDDSFFRCITWWPPFFYNCPTAKSNELNACLSNLNTAIDSFISNVDSSVNSTLSLLSSSIDNMLTNLEACINSQVNITNSALDAISAEYSNCRASQVV